MNEHRESSVQKEENQFILKWDDLTENQVEIAKRFSQMIREVLTSLESGVTHPGQLKAMKRQMQDSMYDCRKTLLEIS